MPFPIVLALAAAQAIAGAVQKNQAKKRAERNQRPEANTSTPYEALLANQQQLAQYGLAQNAMLYAQQENNNSFDAALQTQLQVGGDPNDTAALYGRMIAGNNQLAIESDKRQWDKVRAVSEATRLAAEANTQDFLYNEDGPYKDNAQLAALQEQQGSQNLWNAADTAAAWYQNNQAQNAYDPNDTGGTGERADRPLSISRRQRRRLNSTQGSIA